MGTRLLWECRSAVVGRNAFAHESGIHQHGVLRERTTYEIMDPAAVGQDDSKLLLGKHSGRAAFGAALRQLDINLEDEDFESAFARFKGLADRKGEIGEDGLLAIVHDQVDLSDAVHFLGWHATGKDNEAEATVTIERGGGGTQAGNISAIDCVLIKWPTPVKQKTNAIPRQPSVIYGSVIVASTIRRKVTTIKTGQKKKSKDYGGCSHQSVRNLASSQYLNFICMIVSY